MRKSGIPKESGLLVEKEKVKAKRELSTVFTLANFRTLGPRRFVHACLGGKSKSRSLDPTGFSADSSRPLKCLEASESQNHVALTCLGAYTEEEFRALSAVRSIAVHSDGPSQKLNQPGANRQAESSPPPAPVLRVVQLREGPEKRFLAVGRDTDTCRGGAGDVNDSHGENSGSSRVVQVPRGAESASFRSGGMPMPTWGSG